MAFIKEMTAPASMPKALQRTNALPLDSSAVWYSLEQLQVYARGDVKEIEDYNLEHGTSLTPTAYVGQIVSLVDQEENTSVAYMIANTTGDLVQVGAVEEEGPVVNPTLGDNATIVVENDIAKMYNFGKAFYRWDSENEEYIYQEVSEDYPWKAGLEARVVEDAEGNLVLGWFEVSPQITNEIAGIISDIRDIDDAVLGLQDEIDGYTAEDGTEVPGLKAEVENLKTVSGTLETNVDKLQTAIGNVYTKEETNELVAGLFHFKDVVNSTDDLPDDALEGDVYQVGNAEWVWNGEQWVELGFTVDLTNYATKDHVTQQLANYATNDSVTNAITNALTPVNGEIANNKEAIEENKTAINNLIAVDGRIDTMEKAIAANTNSLKAVNGDIATLKAQVGTAKNGDIAGTGLTGRVEDLEIYIEQLHSVGGQPNLIEKIFAGETELAINEKAVTIPVYNGAFAGLVPVMNSTLVAENKTNADYVLNGAGQWKLMEDSRINNLTIDDTTYSTVEEYIAKYVELNAGANIYWEAIENT